MNISSPSGTQTAMIDVVVDETWLPSPTATDRSPVILTVALLLNAYLEAQVNSVISDAPS